MRGGGCKAQQSGLGLWGLAYAGQPRAEMVQEVCTGSASRKHTKHKQGTSPELLVVLWLVWLAGGGRLGVAGWSCCHNCCHSVGRRLEAP